VADETFDDFEKRNRELFFLLFLFQFYLQGIKARFAQVYALRQAALVKQFIRFINENRYETLDGFRKAELRQFIYEMKQSQANFYSSYLKELIGDLIAFIGADHATSTEVYEYAFNQTLADAEDTREHPSHAGPQAAQDTTALWKVIRNTPVTCSGQYPVEMGNDLAITHIKKLGQLIQSSASKKMSKSDLIDALETQQSTFQNQAISLQAALIQHVHGLVSLAVGSIFVGAYMWCSILDQHTTDFCIEHNGRVYLNGKGPTPPGHWGCRAHTMPVDATQAAVPLPTFSAYTGTLPISVQSMLAGFSSVRPLTNQELQENMQNNLKGLQ
jgi:hypothetical protein